MGSTVALPSLNANGEEDKPLHIVMLPWLAMGHIYPYFEFAKVLAQKGHSVTFISSPKNIDRIPKSPKSLEPFIKLVRLPLPHIEHLPEGSESTMDTPMTKHGYLQLAYEGLHDPVAEILQSSKPDWVLYDVAAGWLPPLAKSLNIPCAHYSTIPAWDMCIFNPPKDKIKPKSSLKDRCVPPDWVPFHTTMSLRPYEIMRVLAMVAEIKADSTGKSVTLDVNKGYSGCDMFLLRTSRELEGEWLDFMAEQYKVPVVPVGLLPPSMQIRDAQDEEKNPDWVKIKAWLDTQDPSSVLYIGFGSELRLSQQYLTELAHGIELSGLPFFWALRNLKEEPSLELPEGFENRTNERGIVWKTWAPQLKILAHAAIGGCMTHCGMSSVIEMVQYGHVLVTLPYFPEQCLNSRAFEEKKVAIEVPRNEKDGSFTRDSMAKTLRLAIVDEEGKVYRNNAKEMGKVFESEDLHNQYIQDSIAALQKYRRVHVEL